MRYRKEASSLFPRFISGSRKLAGNLFSQNFDLLFAYILQRLAKFIVHDRHAISYFLYNLSFT